MLSQASSRLILQRFIERHEVLLRNCLYLSLFFIKSFGFSSRKGRDLNSIDWLPYYKTLNISLKHSYVLVSILCAP